MILKPFAQSDREVLEEVLETIRGQNSAKREQWPFLDAQRPAPFEELLAPLVAVARQRFDARCGRASLLLDETAQLNLQRHLLQVLTSLALDTFYAEFVHMREQVGITTPTADGSGQLDEAALYRRFLRHMSEGGLAALLQTYSVLADLLTTACDRWISAIVEFVQRLAADWSALARTFSDGSRIERVVQIQPALSDTHAGGRCVMALTFDNGTRLVYKPRSLGMEETFYTLLRWCYAQGAYPPGKIPALLPRADYGWMEFIAYEPCQDRSALLRYFERAGILLCLVYVLSGRNCFYDHVIAHGEHPVLVDASTLMQPYLSPKPRPCQGEDWEQELYSVLDTGLLATWQRRAAASKGSGWSSLDISGLGLDQVLAASRQGVERLSISRQALALKYGVFKPRPAWHIACCADPAGLPEQEKLRAALSAGFRRTYQIFLQQHTTLLAADSPLQALKGQKIRIIYRDRYVYERLLPKMLKPQALREVDSRSLTVTWLERESVPTQWFRMARGDAAHWRRIAVAEQQALLQHEIPVFSARADSDALTIVANQEVASCLFQPAFDLLQARLKRLSAADLHRQYTLLQRALPGKAAPGREEHEQSMQRTETAPHSPDAGQLAEQPDSIPAATLISQALSIADDIARDALDIDGETVTWVGASISSHMQYYQLQALRFGLYDGVSGIALFLAAAARSSGLRSYGRLALAALGPLPRLLREDGTRLVHEMGLGAGPGLGSLIYALTRIAQLLNQPELLEQAGRVARLITPELIANDEFFEILLGTAGTILGLLALYDAAPATELLDLAVSCGRRLVNARTPSKVGCRAWPTLGKRHTTGFAHGTAGIAYALLRLYAQTGEADFLQAAREGLLYEDQAFVPERDNWREAVDEETPSLMTSWCHGAPGIGLARVAGLSILDTPSIRRDIEAALRTTEQSGSQGALHLCCGASGRAEFLLTAARRLGRPELARAAVQCMEQVVSGVQHSAGGFLDAFFPAWVEHHSLFQGTAGIGYTLLRLAQPEIVPSVLLWE